MQLCTRIPYFVDPPDFSAEIEEEITSIIFGEVIEPEPADLIFIFGGSHPGLWYTAAEAFRCGLAPHILATGGIKRDALRHHSWNYGDVPESQVIARNLIRLGVPEDCITVEARSTNTYENVRNALSVYDFSTVYTILAVSKSYGVGRQTRTLRAQVAHTVQVVPLPFDTHLAGSGPIITRHSWTNHEDARSHIFANLLKTYAYGQLGHVELVAGLSKELETKITGALEDQN